MPRFASIALSVSLLAGSLVILTALPAHAHTPAVSSTCAKLTVSLQSYSTTQNNQKPNRVTVVIDGSTAANESFGTSFGRDFSFSNSGVAHNWKVVIDAVDDGYDRTFTGSSSPCLPKDATAALHTTAPSCTSASTLVLDAIVNAKWSTPTQTTGPGTYSVTATATSGHLFDDGTAKRVFTGQLAAPLDSASAECTPRQAPAAPKPQKPAPVVSPVAPAKPTPTESSSRSVTVNCGTRVVSTTTTTTRSDWVLDASGTNWVAAEPVVTVASSNRPANDSTCPAIVASASVSSTGGGGVGGAAALDSLAHAGTDALVAILAALAAVAGGIAVVARRRRVSTEK